ncbi:(2Fe-2S)-binding protein [Rhodobium gokarnense]|uniref:Bacterioferritin-associated ferredoxin n=1 Tax=Rhodobium gokarnense TaxID=364296 RepID=A0ABT3HFM0_9HYPH|nr:(2Fe-2S)-binding protein [Rhodobium gokarnense]MCW2309124.1 bacterioferritin-associated ferredoxin [Rhodobium gokarnense]
MIVCSCNVISDLEIEEAVLGLLKDDPWRLIVPGHVYKEMRKRGKCCNCFPNVVQIIERATERFHRTLGTADADRTAAFLSNLKAEHRRIVEMRRARREVAAKQWKKTIAA